MILWCTFLWWLDEICMRRGMSNLYEKFLKDWHSGWQITNLLYAFSNFQNYEQFYEFIILVPLKGSYHFKFYKFSENVSHHCWDTPSLPVWGLCHPICLHVMDDLSTISKICGASFCLSWSHSDTFVNYSTTEKMSHFCWDMPWHPVGSLAVKFVCALWMKHSSHHYSG